MTPITPEPFVITLTNGPTPETRVLHIVPLADEQPETETETTDDSR
jgi:hypothetical protein